MNTLEQLQQQAKGKYFSLIYRKESNGIEKFIHMVCRIVKYANIKGVEVKNRAVSGNYEYLNNNIKLNVDTGEYSILVATTKNSKLHSKSKYYNNNIEIDKEEAERLAPELKSHSNNKTIVMTLKVNQIVKVGK